MKLLGGHARRRGDLGRNAAGGRVGHGGFRRVWMPIAWCRSSCARRPARACGCLSSANEWWRQCGGEPAPGEFRSNLHRGGNGEKVRPTPAERGALRCGPPKPWGCNVAGVDMLQSNRGPLVMAVNSSPEMEGIERATGVDVAGKIFDFLERRLALEQGKARRSQAAQLELVAH